MRIARLSFVAAASAVAAAAFCLLSPHAAVRAQAQQHPDLSGFWQLRYDGTNIPPAKLVPGADSPAKRAAADKEKFHAIRFCDLIGMPAVMSYAPTLDIRAGATDVAILMQSVSPPRHIYVDGRAPNWDIIDPTTIGYSLGHWEGDALIVETRDFSDKSITEIPGGGYRTENSILMESFKLVQNGNMLEYTATWTDPKMFAEPHTYAYRYSRMPQDYRAEEWYCNAADNDRGKFLVDPPTPVVSHDAVAQPTAAK